MFGLATIGNGLPPVVLIHGSSNVPVVDNELGAERRAAVEAEEIPDVRQIVEDAVRTADRHPAVALRIPHSGETRREVVQASLADAATRILRVALEDHPHRRVLIDRTAHTRVELFDGEVIRMLLIVDVRQIRVPSQSEVDRHVR
jgi:hypothetical protein